MKKNNGPPHLHFPISFEELNNLNKTLRRDIVEVVFDLKEDGASWKVATKEKTKSTKVVK